jgi:multidrug efflux pump subunit AcrB
METLFYRERRLTALAVLVLFAAGLSSFLTIGRQEDPTITNLFATIITPYPGADPARVEALVTEKIEEELREIAEIDVIESVSRNGLSSVTVELSKFITDEEIEQAWSEIRDALADAAARFPAGVPDPSFDNDRTGAFSAISAILPRHDDVSTAVLARYAEELADRLRALNGAKIVRDFGRPTEEVLVTIDPVRLADLGLTAGEVAATIAEADSKVSAGTLQGARADLLVEVAGEIDGIERVLDIPLATSADGLVTRVGDIATVSKGERDPPDTIAHVDGRRAVLVAARMDEGLQVDAWMARVRGILAEFEAELPDGLEHRLLFDQSGYTAERLTEVAVNMAIGVSLVVIVLFVTMGARAALVVAVVLPLVSLASIATLQYLSVPIHQMSVTGMVVALGLLVDAAIVMTDEIRQRLGAGMPREQAVGQSVKRLAVPLLASTVTTALAFMPMALLPGPAGDFVGSIATAVIVMLIWSLIIALTVTAAFAGLILPDGGSDGGRDGGRGKLGFLAMGVKGGPLARAFAFSIRTSLRHPVLSVIFALILPVMGFLTFPTLTAQFFPGVDRDQFYIDVELPPGASIRETDRLALEVDALLADQDGIRSVSWVVGESAPAFYYNIRMDKDGADYFARALVTTDSKAATTRLIAPLQNRLDAAFPSARILVRDLVQGPPVAAPVELRFVGPDLAVLRELGDEARRIVATVPEITHARTTVTAAPPKLEFRLDEDRVRLAGLRLVDVARQLDAALEGVVGGSLIEGTEELPVRVRVANAERADVAFIETFDVIAPGTAGDGYVGVPLSALGEAAVVPSESAIYRRDGVRNNTVQGFVQYGVLPQEALSKVRAALDAEAFALPLGYTLEVGGDSDARNETLNNLLAPIGLIVTLTVATIVLTFNSFRLATVALVVCVLSAGLSILSLAVMQYPFGITAVIGVIGSIGVSINAAIILMTALQADPKARSGDREAMADVVTGASRHIVSTTLTTFGGFLPLILEGGGFWPPFATSIAGGVLLSTVVSFYFTPPMFALVYAGRAKAEAAQPTASVTPLRVA